MRPREKPQKANRKARDRRWHLLRSAKRVGMTREIFALVIQAEEKCCAICGATGKLVNDHCHERKRHRGRLCHPCNAAIGLMKDNPRRLMDAADYLIQFEERFEPEEENFERKE